MEPQSSLFSHPIVCFFRESPAVNSLKNFEIFSEACFRFTPRIAVRSPEALFLDIKGCEHFFSQNGLFLRLIALGKRFFQNEKIQIAFAQDAPTALALARYPHVQQKKDLPLEAIFDYRDPFGNDKDFKENRAHLQEIIEVSRKLGLKTVGDFMGLPTRSLASRFGKNALEIHLRFRGEWKHAWPSFQPKEEILEKSELLDEIIDLEPIFFFLKPLVDRTMARLRGLGKRASKIAVIFDLKKFSTLSKESSSRTWELDLPVPQGSTLGLFRILREKINWDLQRRPLDSFVQQVEFRVLETVPGSFSQLNFLNKKEEEQELWDALLGRLVSQLGKENVFLASPVERYLPEKAWTRQLTAAEPQTTFTLVPTSIPPRPLRLLKKPERVRLEGKSFILLNGSKYKILHWDGPERLQGEWWKEPENFSRDYYRVTVDQGTEFWIFLNKKEKPPDLFLHGYFD